MKYLLTTILAGSILLCSGSSAFAQRGGRGGGGYRGGYNGGGYYGGGYYGGGYYGGFNGGGYYGHYGSPGFGISFGVPYGYSYPWGHSRYDYGYGTPYYGGSYSYGTVDPYPLPATVTTTPAPAAADTNAVNMEVRLPENATLWIEGQQVNETGTVRHFVSPPLAKDNAFVYNIRARWTDADGKAVEKTKKIDVKAGAWIGVDFNRADK